MFIQLPAVTISHNSSRKGMLRFCLERGRMAFSALISSLSLPVSTTVTNDYTHSSFIAKNVFIRTSLDKKLSKAHRKHTIILAGCQSGLAPPVLPFLSALMETAVDCLSMTFTGLCLFNRLVSLSYLKQMFQNEVLQLVRRVCIETTISTVLDIRAICWTLHGISSKTVMLMASWLSERIIYESYMTKWFCPL